tara:strand:+ start:7229 stop:7804 length:576 start_codon:yes stop_codon:yes gene_type:complete
LLDFVKDPGMSVRKRDGKFEVNYKGNDKGEKILLKDYDKLLDELEENSDAPTYLQEKFSISEEFLTTVQDRFEGKFDVVFLDYLGATSEKRAKVLESLVKRRLNGQAMVATTFNLASRVNHQRSSGLKVAEIPDTIFYNAWNIFGNNGFEVVDHVFDGSILPRGKDYQDGTDRMGFQAYFVKQTKEDGGQK